MNELRKKYKEETKQPITEKPMGDFDYFKDEYVFWLENKLEAINYTRCCEELVCDKCDNSGWVWSKLYANNIKCECSN